MNSKQHPGTREFPTLRAALLDWAKLNDRQEVWSEIEKIIHELEKKNGASIGFYVPAADSYVGVKFVNDDNYGAYIHVGHVDHPTELPNSSSPNDSPYFRSYLSTSQGQAAGHTKESKSNLLTCPKCSMQISKYAECSCGWSPTDVNN
jgi:hypothetical protein